MTSIPKAYLISPTLSIYTSHTFFLSYLAILLLPQAGVNDPLEDVLLGCGGLQVSNQVESLGHLGVSQVVDDQVQAGLGGDVAELGEGL